MKVPMGYKQETSSLQVFELYMCTSPGCKHFGVGVG